MAAGWSGLVWSQGYGNGGQTLIETRVYLVLCGIVYAACRGGLLLSGWLEVDGASADRVLKPGGLWMWEWATVENYCTVL